MVGAAFGAKASSTCDELSELLDKGRYKSAYKLLVTEGEYTCGKVRYAEVLRWNGRYQEALDVVQDEHGTEAERLIEELKVDLGIKKKKELYSVRPFDGNDSVSHRIFMVSETPILFREEEVAVSVFPTKVFEERTVFKSAHADTSFHGGLIEEFLDRQNTHRFWLGPSCLGPDSTLYYTARYDSPLYSGGRQSEFVIYTWDGKKHRLPKWIKKGSAHVHPTVTRDGWIIFSSDREGGHGGMDLWKMNLNASEGEPINLGPDVNSAFDEVYPMEAGDSLYFSTNDPERTIGGYDVLLFAESKVANPGKPLNSVSDDFNPYTVNGSLAYINTDRLYPGEVDLIVRVKPFKSRLLFDLIHGKVENKNLEAGDKVELLDGDGNLLDYTYIDKEGKFTFTDLKGLEDYTFSFGEGQLSEGDRVSIFDKDFELMEELVADESGQAKFELLTPEDYMLEKEANSDDSMLSVDISGMFSSQSDRGDKENVEIFLQDPDGNTLARAFINENGEFAFDQVRPDQSYSFKAAVTDPGSDLRIFNQNGEIIAEIAADNAGEDRYIRLKKSDKTITITNEKEVTIKMSESEKFNLPFIYFDFDDTQLNHLSAPVVSQLAQILKDNPHVSIKLAGHTDARGKAKYNLRLSEQRIGSVTRFLVQNGVAKNRIDGRGFGESMPLNQCADGTKCSEREHAENRRIEIQFFTPDDLDPKN